MTGYNNRWLRLAKDILFLGVGAWLLSTGRLLAGVLGLLALLWYGRDAWFQAKALGQEKHYKGPQEGPTVKPAPGKEDRITLSPDAKEVDFKKE